MKKYIIGKIGQFKIQQMVFMIAAVFIFFALAGLFVLSIQLKGTKKQAQFLEEKQQGKVQLMTVHKSKGLQWDNVLFIYDFSLLEQVENDFYDLEEEKRVVYTAVTRPTTNLVIWDLEQQMISSYFTKGSLLKMIENALKKGILDIEDFSKY